MNTFILRSSCYLLNVTIVLATLTRQASDSPDLNRSEKALNDIALRARHCVARHCVLDSSRAKDTTNVEMNLKTADI